MITDAILSFLTSIATGILSPLVIIDVAVDLVTSIPVVSKFIMFVAYVIPWQNLVPLLIIILALIGFRIAMSVIRFVISLLPG